MFYLGGVSLAFFLSLLLISKRKKMVSDIILSGWLLIITFHLLLFYFWKMEWYPQFLALSIPLPLMHGSLLYLYTLSLTGNKIKVKDIFFHFAPAVGVLIYLIPFFALSVEEKKYIYEHEGVGYETFSKILFFITIVSGVAYITLASIVLRKHRLLITHQFSSIENINLKWLQYLVYWLGLIWILVIFSNDEWIFGAVVLFIFFIGFFGIRQASIFIPKDIDPSENKTETNLNHLKEIEEAIINQPLELPGSERPKYQKSGLSIDVAEILHQKLSLLMSHEKLFLETELSLNELARKLDTPPNYLSQVINEREGRNFYDYINALRIQEFKRLASNPENRKFTLLALAQACGFTSKSSFNRHFKKATGKSPSEFIESPFTAESDSKA